ncbi:peptidase S8/S53 domain-containing protein [Rhodocollybia butyracea]|uniref:Peptidase S8/S53 domain-containing protein n=1 Tax=Rhodocollybia butyracea TaxID=206335 RepID=A0A9P5PHK4_9AGAR|nr:peptidase S8/S53 domain-containing protein [Rhodocollybia butyracea]
MSSSSGFSCSAIGMLRLVRYITLLSGLAASIAAGIPSRRSMVTLESRESHAYFANEQKLIDVSTPGNAMYGRHLSYEEAKAFAGPTPDTVQAVTAWLNKNGIKNIATTGAFGEWLGFSVPVSTANSLFNANYQLFNEIDGPTKLTTRTLTYSIPADLQPHINILHPSTDFVRVSKSPKFHTAPIPSTNSSNNTASCSLTPSNATWSSPLAVCRTSVESHPLGLINRPINLAYPGSLINSLKLKRTDLQYFLETFANVPSSTAWQLQTLDDGSDPQGAKNAGIEANLDTQYTIGLANGIPVTFFSVGKDNKDGGLGGFLDLMNYINSQSSPPFVSSYHRVHSYTWSWLHTWPQVPKEYLSFSRLLEGDGSVSGGQSQSCSTFIPTFPSGCPFLTSVGATKGKEETGASCRGLSDLVTLVHSVVRPLNILHSTVQTQIYNTSLSGGGFSNIFAHPSYQADTVEGYLSTWKHQRQPLQFQRPANFLIVNGGEVGTVNGTSCSAPVFASIIALINDGTPPLGFLNPFLYVNPGVLSDITSGDNPGCNTTGFPAKARSDPITGLGTPKFASLAAAVGV